MHLFVKFALFSFLLWGPQQFSCQKANHLDNAIITGFDHRMCPCCGGLMLTFTSDPTPYQAAFYLIDNKAETFGISDSTTFPLHVKLSWEKLAKCGGRYIKVHKLIKE